MRRVLWLTAVVVLFGSSPALAAGIHVYAQVKTSILPFNEISDKTFTVDFGLDVFDDFDLMAPDFGLGGIDFDVSMPGLGNGNVPPTVNTNLVFDTDVPVGEVLRARVFALLADNDLDPEKYVLGINGQPVKMGGINDFFFQEIAFELTGQGVKPLIQQDGDSVDVSIGSAPVPVLPVFASFGTNGQTATVGDFKVVAAALVVKYTEGASAVPEPSAALVFALGVIVVRGATRRRG